MRGDFEGKANQGGIFFALDDEKERMEHEIEEQVCVLYLLHDEGCSVEVEQVVHRLKNKDGLLLIHHLQLSDQRVDDVPGY
jgi:hypothetical protein